MARNVRIEVTHGDRGWPSVAIYTRQPTRYDAEYVGGRVAEEVPAGYTRGMLFFEPGQNGGVRVHTATPLMDDEIVMVIDRDDFPEFIRQLERLAARVEVGM